METRIMPGETPEKLSARLGAPLCAILRINRLPGPAWLVPGRIILAPWRTFCDMDGKPCPAQEIRRKIYPKETE